MLNGFLRSSVWKITTTNKHYKCSASTNTCTVHETINAQEYAVISLTLFEEIRMCFEEIILLEK